VISYLQSCYHDNARQTPRYEMRVQSPRGTFVKLIRDSLIRSKRVVALIRKIIASAYQRRDVRHCYISQHVGAEGTWCESPAYYRIASPLSFSRFLLRHVERYHILSIVCYCYSGSFILNLVENSWWRSILSTRSSLSIRGKKN